MNHYQYDELRQMPYGMTDPNIQMQMPYGMDPNIQMQMPYGMDPNIQMQMPYGMDPNIQMQMPYGIDPNMQLQMPYGIDPNMQMPYEINYPHENIQMPYTGDMKDEVSPESMKDFCKKYKHYLVGMETNDGNQYEGIIERIDQDRVSMLIPDGDNPGDMDYRQFGFGGYGGYPYGYGGFGYPRRFRRFRRHTFPFIGIRRFFFPFFY